MFVPHNFHDRDPSRATVQGVRLQLRGKNSGGFHGFEPDPDPESIDLRSRHERRDEKEHKPKARYFGATYEHGLTVPLESLEPDLTGYDTAEHSVTDLSWNRSMAGTWMRDGA